MSCKKDRNLRAAIALGLLWGMGQNEVGNISIEHRVARLKALLEYVGVNLPVSAKAPDGLQIGTALIRPVNQGWRMSIEGVDLDYPTYAAAIEPTVIDQIRMAIWEEMGDVTVPQDAALTSENMAQWASQFEQVLTQAGAIFAGTPIKIKYLGQDAGGWGSKFQAQLREDHDDGRVLQARNGVHTDVALAIKYSVDNLIDGLMQLGNELEPALGIFDNPGLTLNLIQNGYLNIAYLDENTASSVGGKAQQGWYVVRDGQPYKGPLGSPQTAAQWIKAEWGSDVEKYTLVARLNDQYRAIREQYEQQVRHIQQGSLPEQEKRAALNHITEQLEYATRMSVDPFIMSEQQVPNTDAVQRQFLLQGTQGQIYRLVITPASNKAPWLCWNLYESVNSDTPSEGGDKEVEDGYSPNPAEAVEYHTTPYDMLFHIVRGMIAKGQLAAPKSNEG